MTTIKSYTDIEQSKKLAEILPLESADMLYIKREINDTFIETPIIKPVGDVLKSLPCWSLTALLELIPQSIDIGAFKDCIFYFSKAIDNKSYIADYIQHSEFSGFPITVKQIIADNAIDTLFKIIYWLKENSKL